MADARLLEFEDGRTLAYDDVGDPDGVPVVYLHGTPDSRLARHPDDGKAAAAGIRLLAVDRPGFGGTSAHPSRHQLGQDLVRLLDALELPAVGLLGWSSGGLAALWVAEVLATRCARVALVATLPPVEAYADPLVIDALGPQRRGLVDMAGEMAPSEVALEVAPYLVPLPITRELALEHIAEGAGEVGRAELAGVPGALEQMAEALALGVSGGMSGVEIDLEQQFGPGLAVADITTPVHLVHGELDTTSPPEVGVWLADRLPIATLQIVPGAGHHLLFPLWDDLMRSFNDDPAR